MRVLLLGPDDYGTLAAVRCFARNGIGVAVAGEGRQGRAQFSRFAGERLVHPPLSTPAALIEWLLDWGSRQPGAFLYPSNDDLAWFLAMAREALSTTFRMLSPSEATILTLLDKARLGAVCETVGVTTPRTVDLADAASFTEAASRVQQLGYPLLLKPRTQIRLRGGLKGLVVRDAAMLSSALHRFRGLVSYDPSFAARHPGAAEPLAQEYLAGAETGILSLAGFIGADGACVALSSIKILQRPRKLGIGLCFEPRPVERSLVAAVSALCRQVGYRGVFEAEFVAVGDVRLLLDFNPRFYSQMAFEIARGLPLPLIALRAAGGEGPLSFDHPGTGVGDPQIYCHRGMLELMLRLQRASGQMSGDEVGGWRRWLAGPTRAGAAIDAVRDPDDRMPAVVDGVSWLAEFARHPRSFVNDFVLNR